MAQQELIDSYLRELRYNLSRFGDVDEIVAEAEDHLLEAAGRLVREGKPRADAEHEALARFGSAALVSKVS